MKTRRRRLAKAEFLSDGQSLVTMPFDSGALARFSSPLRTAAIFLRPAPSCRRKLRRSTRRLDLMGAYILRRILLMIPTLFGIMAISFAVIQFAPGGPVEQVIAKLQGQGGDATDRISGGGGDSQAATISMSAAKRPRNTAARKASTRNSSPSSSSSSASTGRRSNASSTCCGTTHVSTSARASSARFQCST